MTVEKTEKTKVVEKIISNLWVVSFVHNGVTNFDRAFKDKKDLLKCYPSLKGENDYLSDCDVNGNGIHAYLIEVL